MSAVGSKQFETAETRPVNDGVKKSNENVFKLPFTNKHFDPSAINQLNGLREKALGQLNKAADKIPAIKEAIGNEALETAAMNAIVGEELINKEIESFKDATGALFNKDDTTIEEQVKAIGLPEAATEQIIAYAEETFPGYLAAVKSRDLNRIANTDLEITQKLLEKPELANLDPQKVLQALFLYNNHLVKDGSFASTIGSDISRKFNIGVATFKDWVASFFAEKPSIEEADATVQAKKVASEHLEKAFAGVISNPTIGKDDIAKDLGSVAAEQAKAFLAFQDIVNKQKLDEGQAASAYKGFFTEMTFGQFKILFRPSTWKKMTEAINKSVEQQTADIIQKAQTEKPSSEEKEKTQEAA